MSVVRPASEPEVIATFLRTELFLLRFGASVRDALGAAGVDAGVGRSTS